MKKYVLPVIVRVFQIERIEGYATFPIRHNSNPAPTPGGMRLVYSKDRSDAPVCVESSFISQIKPYQQGMYVEYPDGHAVFWGEKAFLKAVGAENFNGCMAFPLPSRARGGAKIYSRGWEMKDVYARWFLRQGNVGNTPRRNTHDGLGKDRGADAVGTEPE
jgi:hypothetical protein